MKEILPQATKAFFHVSLGSQGKLESPPFIGLEGGPD